MNTTFQGDSRIRHRRPAAGEDYLEAILRLERTQGLVRVGELAAALEVHKSTVTATLKALAGRGLVAHKRYAAVRLTPQGRAVAAQTTARHALIHDFLMRVLLLDDVVADAHACRMEHIVDADFAGRLEALARFAAARPRTINNWARALRAFVAQEQGAAAAGTGGAP